MADEWLTRKTLLGRALDPEDHDAWGEFVSFYEKFIYSILHRMNIHPNEFDDLVQEILVHLWNKLGLYDAEKSKFRTWLSTVIRNLVFSYLDSNQRRYNRRNTLEGDDVAIQSFHPPSSADFERMVEKEWKMHLSNMALDKLRKKFTGNAIDVFSLSLEGVSNQEISEKLGITKDSVKSLKTRVRGKFIEEMEWLIRNLESVE